MLKDARFFLSHFANSDTVFECIFYFSGSIYMWYFNITGMYWCAGISAHMLKHTIIMGRLTVMILIIWSMAFFIIYPPKLRGFWNFLKLGRFWNVAIDWKFVSLPYQFCMLKLNPNVVIFENGDFGRCLGHEGGVFMNGTSALAKGASKSSLASATMWGHSKQMVVYESGSGPSHQLLNLLVSWCWTSQPPVL